MPMPVGVQLHASRKRAERQTSSCTECRRRKQRCSQGHPCTNCLRRFPQPICEYKTKPSPRRPPIPGYSEGGSIYSTALKEGPYAHLSVAGVQDVILQVAEPAGRQISLESVKPIYFSYKPSPTSGFNILPEGSSGIPGTPYVPFRVALDEDNDPEAMLESLQVIFERRLSMANRIPHNDWVIEDARAVLAAKSQKNVHSHIEGSMEQFRYLPMAPTKMNKELVRIHLQLLCRFKVSVDGSPAPNNQFMKYWVPFCVQDPLLLQIILFTSACFFSETGHIPKTLAMLHKGKAYHMLNEQLRAEETQITDASILGVTQMVVDSWYWGATTDLKAHIRGLKQMIQMRGGLADLGMHGYLAKTILIHDIVMALAHEIEPCIYGHPGFEFNDPIMMPFHIALNSPLIFGWPSFAGCGNSLQLHPSTAMILDDMRYLIESALAVPDNASTADLQRIMTTAGWIMDRISELPEDTPIQVKPDYRSSPASPETQSPGSCRSSVRSDKSSPPVELPDQMYRCVRMTALIYCKAILNRVPTSEICTEIDFLKIWRAAWLATLPTWKATVGVLIWVLLAIVPSGHNAGPARFLKTLMVSGLMSIGVDNWHIAIDIANTGLRLQRWLASGHNAQDDAGKGLTGGETIVDRYGFAIKEVLPPVNLPTDDDE